MTGTLRIREAAPVLRRMALDEQEDLQTRLNSVRSYLSIRGDSAARDVKILLRSRESLVRVRAYITALQSKEAKLRAIAEEQFRVEKDQRVQMMVARLLPRLQRTEMTKDDM